MPDLRTLMHDAATIDEPPVLDPGADVARGRTALRRRRQRRLGASAGLAAAVLGVVAVGTTGAWQGAQQPVSQGPASSGVALVAYAGAQPAGYELDKVPAGWEVRDSTSAVLTLAPVGAAPAPIEPGSTSLVATIGVMTERGYTVPGGVPTQGVEVDGLPGAIIDDKGAGDTRTLYAEQASGDALVIQVWDGLGWDDQQIVDFAESVRVTRDATPGVG
ncbi:MAG: hypothetical protein Q7T56_19935 [Nocardioidaceae bacterium]|nr:hypothetical protein [Nocardioidaceae bacterium]